MLNQSIDSAKSKMEQTISFVKSEIGKIRTGRANTEMFNNILVNYYDNETPLNQVANIAALDAITISIQPFDKTVIAEIEQAIVDAQLGFNPSNNGEKVIINVPPLTEERRRELVKQVKIEIEKSKISCRNVRQKSNDELKRIGKEGVSEDIIRDAEESVQNITNEFTTKIDSIFSSKESDIMQV